MSAVPPPKISRHAVVIMENGLPDHSERTRPTIRVLRGDVAGRHDILGRDDVSQADAVVSGLPWSLFSADRRAELLGRIRGVLAPGAGFSTFAYRHTTPLFSARRFSSDD